MSTFNHLSFFIINPKGRDNMQAYTRKGKYIYFGRYYQNNEKDKEPLKWIVLEEKDNKVLILTDKLIDSRRFDEKTNDYMKSEIRKWLYEKFYQEAFNKEEQDIIEDTAIGKLFLLSVEEVSLYFPDDESKKAKGSKYAIKRGLWVDKNTRTSSWWLRTPINDFRYHAARVYYTGIVDNMYIGNEREGIRCACWIKIK